MNTTVVTWKMHKDELERISYIGSNGNVITRHGVGLKPYMGRNHSKPRSGYYKLNGTGFFPTLKSAKEAAEKLAVKELELVTA